MTAWPVILAMLLSLAFEQGPEAASEREVIDISQAAIGRPVTNLALVDQHGQTSRLDDFIGQPLAISLIYTGCVHSCSVTTHHLKRAVESARHALGDETFQVLTIGFDWPSDNPERLADYARRHRIDDPNWHFLGARSGDEIAQLVSDLGFVYQPSARGYDHTVQVSLIDQDGLVYRQVYGEVFDLPLLVEPLKDLVLDRPAPDVGWLSRLGDRVRLFCTVYDAGGDRYYFDYSMFLGILIGTITLGSVLALLLVEARRKRVASL